MRKRDVAWLFCVIILTILLAVSVLLGLTGYYFSVAYINSNSELTVGDSFSISAEANQSTVASFTFDGSSLPSEKIPQTVQISAKDLNADVRVRVKAVVFGAPDETMFDFVTSEHFEKAEDGYYYYDDILSGGNKITFCSYLVMPTDSMLSSKEKYVLSFVVETLETKFDNQNIWKNVQ